MGHGAASCLGFPSAGSTSTTSTRSVRSKDKLQGRPAVVAAVVVGVVVMVVVPLLVLNSRSDLQRCTSRCAVHGMIQSITD